MKKDNKNEPLVSVIIPAYNAEKCVGYTLDTVINQTYKNLEIIIVNDCSTDKTLDVLNEYAKKDKRIRVMSNDKNSGVAETRNNALKAATGEYIAFIDADDIWALEKIEKQLNFMLENDYKFTYTSYGFIDNEGNPTCKPFIVPKEVTFKALLKQNVINTSTILVKKELWGERFFHDDHLHEDFIMWLEILRDSLDKAYGFQEVVVDYRLTVGSRSRNKWKSMKTTYKVYKYFKINWIKAHWCLMHYIIRNLKKYK